MDAADGDDPTEPPTRPELRLAVAMNGGVSLAVWISGVCNEFVRVIRETEHVDLGTPIEPDDSPYVVAAKCSGLLPRVDVLAGASAGGLNAVFLALGLLHGHRDLRSVRDLWIDLADFDRLFRSPFDDATRSLMKGEEFFLPEIEQLILDLMTVGPADDQSSDLEVLLTVTSLAPLTTKLATDNDTTVNDPRHDAIVRFRHQTDPVDRSSDFIADEALPDQHADSKRRLAARLARACRSTASFPGAFEPSPALVVDDVDDTTRSDAFLRRHLPGVDDGELLLIDGGTLVNLPMEQAAEAVFDQPASIAVQRRLAMVVPNPRLDDSEPKEADQRLIPVALQALSKIPSTQNVAAAFEEVDNRNSAIHSTWSSREALLGRPATELSAAAAPLSAAYHARRNSLTDARLKRELVRRVGDLPEDDVEFWLDSLRLVKTPWGNGSLTAKSVTELNRWGITTCRRSAVRLLWLIRTIESGDPLTSEDAATISDARATVNEVLKNLGAMSFIGKNALLSKLPAEAVGNRSDTQLAAAIETAISARRTDPETLATCYRDLAGLVEPLASIAPERFVVFNDATGLDGGLRLLLDLEVIEVAYGGFGHRIEQELEIVRFDGNGASPLDPKRSSANDKIAGAQAANFGGFFRRSWRANDWMWGRLDSSRDLIELMTQAASPEQRTDAAEALGLEHGDDLAVHLTSQLHTEIVVEETPTVVKTLAEDADQGGTTLLEATRLVEAFENNGTAELLLRTNKIGSETIRDHAGSDQLSRIGFSAAATASTAILSAAPRLLRPVLAFARYVLLALFALTKPGTNGTAVRVVAATLYGFGIAVIAIDFTTGADLGIVRMAGALALICGTIFGLLRLGWWAVALLVAGIVPLVLRALPDQPWGWWPDGWGWPQISGIEWIAPLAFIASLLILGLCRRRSPWRA